MTFMMWCILMFVRRHVMMRRMWFLPRFLQLDTVGFERFNDPAPRPAGPDFTACLELLTNLKLHFPDPVRATADRYEMTVTHQASSNVAIPKDRPDRRHYLVPAPDPPASYDVISSRGKSKFPARSRIQINAPMSK
jgi:hypothetical protein